jgi:hypothetical protein
MNEIIFVIFVFWLVGTLIVCALLRWIFRVNRTVELLEEMNARLTVIIENQPVEDKLESLMRTSKRLPDADRQPL